MVGTIVIAVAMVLIIVIQMLAHNLGAPYFDDVMSYNSLTTI